MTFSHIAYEGGVLRLLDQTKLPAVVEHVELRDWESVADAIRRMVVRGAPAIGIAGAYGLAIAVRDAAGRSDFARTLAVAADGLTAARPTAVNLAWAVRAVREAVESRAASGADAADLVEAAERTARGIHDDDVRRCRLIGDHGAALLTPPARVLTHCNTGELATGGYGTALGIIRSAWRDGALELVFVTETRPLLQGARLTVWELARDGIPHVLITDSMAAHTMRTSGVGAVIVGADRVARNGDVANKIGTYGLAVLARAHEIPFIVAAPLSTFDPNAGSGDEIPIERRAPSEVTHIGGVATAPENTAVSNPAFDVTPAAYVTAIVTERGVVRQPYVEAIAPLLADARDRAEAAR